MGAVGFWGVSSSGRVWEVRDFNELEVGQLTFCQRGNDKLDARWYSALVNLDLGTMVQVDQVH